jgi:hypothetical protein
MGMREFVSIVIVSIWCVFLFVLIIRIPDRIVVNESNITCPEDPVEFRANITCECPEVQYNVTARCPTIGSVIGQHNVKGAHVDFDSDKYLKISEDWGDFYGLSMEPTLFHGNTVLSDPIDEDYIFEPGMLLRYVDDCKNDNNPTIHRISAVYKDFLLMKGDNLNDFEEIQKCQVTHVVIGVLFT